MSLRIAPIPDGAAEALALMHRDCFPEDPWDAASFARLFALYGVFGYLAWFDKAPTGAKPRPAKPRPAKPRPAKPRATMPRATMPWAASFWRATSAVKPRS